MNEKKAVVNHDHPACATGKHRHEKVYVSGSAGGEITEGCKEHYYERIVAETVMDEMTASADNLKKYVIASEILSAPRCKRRY